MLFVERYLHCLKTGQRASYIRKQTKLNFYKYTVFLATFPLHRIAFRSGAKKHRYTECITFLRS